MRNKKTIYTIALLGLLFLFNSCEKEYEAIESIDDAKIQAYIKQNNLNMTKDDSGFYYQILSPGTEDQLVDSAMVFYDFNIKSLSGTVYQDATPYSNISNRLGYVAPNAFRVGMLKLKAGGKLRLIIPSYLAFGKNGSGNIPSNEVILTEISVYPQKTQLLIDDARIQAFLLAKGITATKHSSGVYYQVIAPGTGTDAIDIHSTLTVDYTGRLLTGGVFQSTTGYSNTLSQLVPGWQQILPMFKSGAKLRLFIPSGLAYGTDASSPSIPTNSVLDFDISITSVTN